MKFLIVTPILNTEIGGMERFVIEVSNSLTALGHSVTILTSNKGTPINVGGARVIRKNIKFPKFLNKLLKYLQLSDYANKHLKKNHYDAVIAMGFSGILLDNFIWRSSGSPVLLTKKIRLKNSKNLLSKLYLWLDIKTQEIMERTCLKKSKAQMFPSLYMKSKFEESYNFKSNFWLIPCSAFINRIVRKENKKFWKNLENSKKVLIVNSLSENRKGKKFIFNFLKNNNLSEVKFIIIGETEEKIKKILSKKENIIFAGRVNYENMNEFYKNSNLLLFTSLYEGFPNTILEASSFGLPTISNNIHGINEYFKINKEIIILDSFSNKELESKIKKLSASKNDLKDISKRLKAKSKKLDYNRFSKELVSFLRNRKSKNLLDN